MTKMERRILADMIAARRLVEEQWSLQRLIDQQKEAQRMSDLQRSAAQALENRTALENAAASQAAEMQDALERMHRTQNPRSLFDSAALAALRMPSWMTALCHVADLDKVHGLAAVASQEGAIHRLAREFSLGSSGRGTHALLGELTGWTPPLGIGGCGVIDRGLERGWASSSLARGMAPRLAIATLATELQEELEHDDPAAIRTLNLAAETAESATEANLELAESIPAVAGMVTPVTGARVQAELSGALEQPLLLLHTLGSEIRIAGVRASKGDLRVYRQSLVFNQAGRLASACRAEAIARVGVDIFGVTPDAIDAQMLLNMTCVIDTSSAMRVVAALYVLLSESADADTLKAYRARAMAGHGWVDVADVARILRNNMGTMHERQEPIRYKNTLGAFRKLGIVAFPALPEEWLDFGDRMAAATLTYFRGLRDFIAGS